MLCVHLIVGVLPQALPPLPFLGSLIIPGLYTFLCHALFALLLKSYTWWLSSAGVIFALLLFLLSQECLFVLSVRSSLDDSLATLADSFLTQLFSQCNSRSTCQLDSQSLEVQMGAPRRLIRLMCYFSLSARSLSLSCSSCLLITTINVTIYNLIRTGLPYNQYMQNPQSPPAHSQGVLLNALRNQLANNYNLNEEEEKTGTQINGNYGNTYRKPAFWPNYDMENSFIDLNESFIYVGDNSIFQKRITMILAMQWISFTFLVMGMTYVFRTPVFYCFDAAEHKVPCSQQVACQNIDKAQIDYPNSLSITEEFELICSKQYLVTFTQSLLFLGGFLSGYIFSYLSSKIGSRSVLIIVMIMAYASVLTCAFSTDYSIFMIGFFFTGFCMFGYETAVYTYIAEISAPRFRAISINILTIVWAGAPILFPIINLSPSWRHTFITISIPLLVSLPFMYKCFLESPRFLVKKGCFRQAREVFRQISITNKRPPYAFRLEQQIQFENRNLTRIKAVNRISANMLATREFKPTRAYNYLDLFKYPSLRKKTICMMIFWMVRFYVYYGLTLGLETIATSGTFLAYTIAASSIAQVLGTFGIPIMTIFVFNKFKLDIMRKCIFIVTICCILLWFVKIPTNCMTKQSKCTELYQTVALILAIKFFITIFYTGLISYSSQIFPTDVRSLGSGFCLTFGRLGNVILPFYINYMKTQHFGQNPISLLFPFTLLVYLLSYILPYTQEVGMKDRIDQEQEQQRQMRMNIDSRNLNQRLLHHNN